MQTSTSNPQAHGPEDILQKPKDAPPSGFTPISEVTPQEGKLYEYTESFLTNPDSLRDVPSEMHKVVALALIEAGGAWMLVKNLEKFEGLDYADIAFKLIALGEGEVVAENISLFKNIDNLAVAVALIEKGEGSALADNLLKFKNVDQVAIVNKIVEAGEAKAIVDNLSTFKNLNLTIALKLIKARFHQEIAENLSSFTHLNIDVAYSLIMMNFGSSVANTLSAFTEDSYAKIGLFLVQRGEYQAVAENLSAFKNLNSEVARHLVTFGAIEEVTKNLSSFEGLGSGLLKEFVRQGYARNIVNLDAFKDIDLTILQEDFVQYMQDAIEDEEYCNGILSSILLTRDTLDSDVVQKINASFASQYSY